MTRIYDGSYKLKSASRHQSGKQRTSITLFKVLLIGRMRTSNTTTLNSSKGQPSNLSMIRTDHNGGIYLSALSRLVHANGSGQLRRHNRSGNARSTRPIMRSVSCTNRSITSRITRQTRRNRRDSIDGGRNGNQSGSRQGSLKSMLLNGLFSLNRGPNNRSYKRRTTLRDGRKGKRQARIPMLDAHQIRGRHIAIRGAQIGRSSASRSTRSQIATGALSHTMRGRSERMIRHNNSGNGRTYRILRRLTIVNRTTLRTGRTINGSRQLGASSSYDTSRNKGSKSGSIQRCLRSQRRLTLLIHLNTLSLKDASLLGTHRDRGLVMGLISNANARSSRRLTTIMRRTLSTVSILRLNLIMFTHVLRRRARANRTVHNTLSILRSTSIISSLLKRYLMIRIPLRSFSGSWGNSLPLREHSHYIYTLRHAINSHRHRALTLLITRTDIRHGVVSGSNHSIIISSRARVIDTLTLGRRQALRTRIISLRPQMLKDQHRLRLTLTRINTRLVNGANLNILDRLSQRTNDIATRLGINVRRMNKTNVHNRRLLSLTQLTKGLGNLSYLDLTGNTGRTIKRLNTRHSINALGSLRKRGNTAP